jgi:hypothetical protein
MDCIQSANAQRWLKVMIGWCRRHNTRVGVKYRNIFKTKEHDSDIIAHVMELTNVTPLTM